MKKSTKISLLVSLALVIIGAVLIFVSLMVVGFDMRKFSNISFEKKVFDITDSFDGVHVSEITDDIEIYLSDDKNCKIICYDSEKIYHECNVNDDGQLMIFCRDDRPWYEKIGFFYKEIEKIQIYLPNELYEEIYAYSTNGNITIPKGFTFDEAHLSVVNGKIHCSADVLQNLTAETTNGDIALDGELNGKIHALTTNGKIVAKNIKNAGSADFTTTNGDIEPDGEIIKYFQAHSVNGSIKFRVSVSDRMHMNTVNGSITGTVPANKSYTAQSTNGSVNVPDSVNDNGDFYFKTVNGNIDIKNK